MSAKDLKLVLMSCNFFTGAEKVLGEFTLGDALISNPMSKYFGYGVFDYPLRDGIVFTDSVSGKQSEIRGGEWVPVLGDTK